MVKSVIGFFPGAGGNRFLRYLRDQEYQTLHMSYDHLTTDQSFVHRYLMQAHYDLPQNEIILTHCMNQKHIREVLDPNVNIIILHFPIQSCLRREWILHGRDRYISQNQIVADNWNKKLECYDAIKTDQWPEVKNLEFFELLPTYIQQEVNDNFAEVIDLQANFIEQDSAMEVIRWHHNYYQKYPVDTSNCIVLRIDDDNDFCRFMHEELELYQSSVFDSAWKIITNEE